MSDLINNLEGVYKKWQERSQSAFNNRGQNRNYQSTSSDYSRSNYNRYDGRRNRQRKPDYNKLPKYAGLAHFKMAPIVQPLSKPRPFMGTCCDKCLSMSKANVVDTRVFLLSICNVLHTPHFQNLEFKSVLNIFDRNKKTLYPDVSENVKVSKKVLKAVEHVIEDTKIKQDISQEESSSLKSTLNSQVKTLIDSLSSTVSVVFLQFSSILLRFGLSKVFDGVLIHKGQIELLKNINQNETPIVYIPVHYNTFDHFLISFILFMNSIHVPLVVTDYDQHIPLLRCLLKFFGAIYVQRCLEKERKYKTVYWSVLQSYFTECLRNGQSLEFPVDGGRSRSGRPYLSESGYLSVIMDSVLKGHIEDAYVSTVSISYEKVLDTNFINEQLGQSQLRQSFFSTFCSIWRLLHCRFGNIRFNISQPFSIKEFFRSSVVFTPGPPPSTETPPSSPCSMDGLGGDCEIDYTKSDLKLAVKKLVKHISYDITSCTAIMSTHLVAFLLLTQFRKGATQQQLEHSMDWLRAELLKKRRDTGFSGAETRPILLRAISLLGRHLVSTETVQVEFRLNDPVEVTLFTPVDKVPEVIELQFYARSVVPVFLLESAIVNAVYVLVDVEICHFRHCDSRLFVSRDKLIDKATELIEILQFEFTATPPCADVCVVFNEVIDSLIEKECLHLVGAPVSLGTSTRYSKTHTLCFDSSDGEDSGNDEVKQQQLKIDLSEESISHLEFLRNILSPYIESYWLAATTLLKLVDEIKEEANFVQEMQNTAQEKLYKGLLAYEESFSADTFKNALKLFEHWQVIESYNQDGLKIVYLSDVYNCREKIGDIISKIEDFRK